MRSSGNVRVLKSADRGHDSHAWLDSWFTFSFSSYYHPNYNGFGPLKVINEDKIKAGKGFPMHAHSELEIFSYIVSGELHHEDSMGNKEVCKKGDVQFTSAGTGIKHSERNGQKSKNTHLLQIWVEPNQSKLVPSYATMNFADSDKKNKLCTIISSIDNEEETRSIKIHQDLTMFASILELDNSVTYHVAPGRKCLIQIVQKADDPCVCISHGPGEEIDAKGGDVLFVTTTKSKPVDLKITGKGKKTEFVLVMEHVLMSISAFVNKGFMVKDVKHIVVMVAFLTVPLYVVEMGHVLMLITAPVDQDIMVKDVMLIIVMVACITLHLYAVVMEHVLMSISVFVNKGFMVNSAKFITVMAMRIIPPLYVVEMEHAWMSINVHAKLDFMDKSAGHTTVMV
ncbi:quercetin 2,3-dioxygenase [Acrasis kona]|uniref:Quercetin 2,3-dioxygenase n=1 Tax=Acrasis kona TaxID=1008807 RepID=A0AAW2ZHC0_9EUKA